MWGEGGTTGFERVGWEIDLSVEGALVWLLWVGMDLEMVILAVGLLAAVAAFLVVQSRVVVLAKKLSEVVLQRRLFWEGASLTVMLLALVCWLTPLQLVAVLGLTQVL